MIQHVEYFKAQLKIGFLFDREPFQQGRVQFIGSVLQNVGKGGREGPDVVLKCIGGLGIERRRVEGDGVGLAVVEVQGTAQVDVVSRCSGTAVDPYKGLSLIHI